jgi:hypothetical protein
VKIQNINSGQIFTPPGFQGLLPADASYTSLVNGKTLDAAWGLEMEVPQNGLASPQGRPWLRIWGISLAEIAQANNLGPTASGGFTNNIFIYGGMAAGLPLANPKQSGLLFSGTIEQCWGNWIGTAMTLDFIIMPGTTTGVAGGIGTIVQPKNIVLNWKAGQTLATALASSLSTAFPNYKQSISISSNIIRQNDETGYFPTLEQLAQYCRQTSFDIIKTSGYLGVSIVLQGDVLSVTDGSAQGGQGGSKGKMISFTDLIGQPTWIENQQIQIKTVMRADLNFGSQITLPPTLITNTQQANSNLVNQKLAFQGGFSVVSIRHFGDYRNPSPDSWCTLINAVPNQQETSSVSSKSAA